MIRDREEERLMKEKIEKMKKRFSLEKNSSEDYEVEIEVDDDNFQENVIEKSKKVPVLVDFYADWCTPCKILSPILEKIVKEYKGKFILAKANVDKVQIIVNEFGIMSVPTVMLFKNGELVDYFVGALPEPKIKEWLDRRLWGCMMW